MSTSLAAQLQKLALPQAKLYKEDKKTVSLLFDPKEAALKDRDTFYEIGKSGLNELIALNESFIVFEDTLFSQSSKDFERAMQTKEVNDNLDVAIEKFLLQLSPYILLQPAHKAFEWLVNRYHIHQYNQDAIIALVLPYYSTNIFVRIIQLLEVPKDQQSKWYWLTSAAKQGKPLHGKIFNRICSKNLFVLNFIGQNTVKYAELFGERAHQLNTVFAFYCQTALGTLNRTPGEPLINAILPPLFKALKSPIVEFKSSGYMILAYLLNKVTLKNETLHEIVDILWNADIDLSYNVVLLLNILYKTQKNCTRLPQSVLNDLSWDRQATLAGHLKKLIEKKYKITQFLIVFLSDLLKVIQKNSEEFMRFCKLPQLLLDEIDLKSQFPQKIIETVIYLYRPIEPIKLDDESDVEIIGEEDNDFGDKTFAWYRELLQSFERQYPDAFEATIKKELLQRGKKFKRDHISKLLGFKPQIALQIDGTYLFEVINNVMPQKRVKAIRFIQKEYETLKEQVPDFVKESIVNRLLDDDSNVVDAALDLPSEYLEESLDEAQAANVLINICRNNKKYKPVVKKALQKLCSLNVLPVTQDTILTLIPYLFPSAKEAIGLTMEILTSKWAKKLNLKPKTINLSEKEEGIPQWQTVCDLVFTALFIAKTIHFDDYLDENTLNKQNTTDVCMYMLLKSTSFDKAPVEVMSSVMNLLLETVETSTIVVSQQIHSFKSQIMPEFIKNTFKGKILFEAVEYLFSKFIQDLNMPHISKPWVNVCKTSEMRLIRKLYEICLTGCNIASYSNNYINLLSQLLSKFFKNPKEKFEFIINFACGHILYAADPKDVIGPELQLRSLKLLSNFVSIIKSADWLYESDAVILLVIFNLNNPITSIRECTLDIVEKILETEPDKKRVYVRLMADILERKQEVLLDHNQISQILINIINDKDSTTKVYRRNCLIKLTGILNSDIPTHIKSALVNILYRFDTATAFPHIVPVLNDLEKNLLDNASETKLSFDIYESNLLRGVYSLINESTVTTFDKETVWKSIEIGLKEYRECVLSEDQTFTSPSVLIMKQIEEETFKNVPKSKRVDLVRLIALAGAVSNNPSISSVASKVMKKIQLTLADFKPILDKMLDAEDPANSGTKKKKSTGTILSYELTETEEWRLGVAILEYVQNKKKMEVNNSFVSTMFELISKCLRFEEQSYVEYTKQLILSSLWYYCKKFADKTDEKAMKAIKSAFKVDLIVQCIRGTQNPQTHHHALILLSHAAYMLPEQVLHHTMEIFTFMGSSVLRHDDAYSFQIITRIIETLIPILVKMDKSAEEYTDKELEQLQKRAVPVLRIFADVVLDVPEHRRLPLYKKLIETIGPNNFLWVLIALLLEAHVAHFNENKKSDKKATRTLADQESPINRVDFGQSILLEFPPEIWLENFVKLVLYIKSLPMQKDENTMGTDIDPSDVFSVNGHTPIQLRHYKYAVITFMNNCLSSSRFIQHNSLFTDVQAMETNYKTLIINILTFIQSISKVTDENEKAAIYWRVMLHHSYDLLDHTNNLLSAPMFLSVIRGLLKHTLQTVRRKSMELLNAKIQHHPEFLENESKELLYSLLDPLLDIIKTIETNQEGLNETTAQELELNQQTALLSLKLLTRLLAGQNPERFKPVLEKVTEYTCNPSINGNVMASIVLCLAELCSNLKAHALASLRKFMPALIKVLRKQRQADSPELVLLSTVTAISKIVESLPLFLSPYLQKILYEYSILLAKWQISDQEQVPVVVTKLATIKKKIASAIPPRVLIPVVNETHQVLLSKEKFDAIGPIMSVLADSFANVTTADFTALQQDLTAFFLTALELRSDASEKDIDDAVIDSAEDEVVNALVSLVLKLSETSFRPFYFKLYDWAIRTNVEGKRERAITFYRLSSAIADQLKGLFVLFAGHFVKNASDLLDACNKSKTEDTYFESEEKCINLIKYIIKTLHVVFLYDSQSFLNKDRFETLMQPIVDQLENTLGGIPSLKSRATEYIIPCVSQFAVATADDSLWKLLNYQILLKTRHNDAEIRLIALECLVSMATQLGSSWLPLLAESVPFLAELLEDGDSRIESSTKDAIRKLEQILGEPLEKYF